VQHKINSRVLVSGADFFSVAELNPYSEQFNQPNIDLAKKEHLTIVNTFKQVGIDVVQVPPPLDCQDGIYTANWALCWQNKCILSVLPNLRQAEQPYAKEVIAKLGYKTITPPFKFSGQGDSLACGKFLFVGSGYRTDSQMHDFLQQEFDCQVIGVRTIPQLDSNHQPVINKITGWPDSFFYDLDLALGVIRNDLIVWCPEAFTESSRIKIDQLPLQKIVVTLDEAINGFACNLVSTGDTVIMSSMAPHLENELKKHGLNVITPSINQLSKGGGYIRCCSLTLG